MESVHEIWPDWVLVFILGGKWVPVPKIHANLSNSCQGISFLTTNMEEKSKGFIVWEPWSRKEKLCATSLSSGFKISVDKLKP